MARHHSPLLAALVAVLLPCTAAAQANLQALQLQQEALAALAAGDLEAAREGFEAALERDRDDPLLYLGVGLVAYEQQRISDAREALDRALRLEPELTTARRLLARMRYEDGDLFRAILELEQAVATAPADAALVEELDRWRREFELHDGMQQTLNERFTVSFEGPPEAALADRALESLDRAYWRIGQTLSLYPLEPIPVVLYTSEQFRDITESPEWAAGAFDGRTIRVPMGGALDHPDALDRVLAHEFAHVLIHEIAPRGVPTWLNEGLASALEGDDPGWAAEQLRQDDHDLTLAALGGRFDELSAEEAVVAYALSEVAVRRLLDEAGGIALANLIRDLGEGVPLDTAFEHRLYRPLDRFLENAY